MTPAIKRIMMYVMIGAIFLTVGLKANSEEPITTLLEDYNTVVLRGRINFKSATFISQQLLEKDGDARTSTVFLILDSGGGSIVAGNSIIATMKSLNNPVVCIAIYAASMAHGILQNCFLRYATEDGVSMLHRARGRFGGYFNEGEVESQLRLWKSIVTKMEKTNAKRMELPYEEYKKLAANEFWCQGEECVENNFVSYITNLRCSPELLQVKFPIGNGWNVKGYLSGCPLIRGIMEK